MPKPSSSVATLRPDLGGSLEEFALEADRAGFICLQALPVFDAAEQAGSFGRIPIEELLKKKDTRRSPRSGYSQDDFEFEPDSYAVLEYGAETPIDDREARIYRNFFDYEMVCTRRARDQVLRNQEIRVAELLQDTGTFASAAASVAWTEWATASPIDDIEALVLACWQASGLWPNGMIIPRQTFRQLRNCQQVIDRLNGNGIRDVTPEKVTAAMLAMVFDLPNVMIAGGTQNTAQEGQTAAFGGCWDKDKVVVGRFATSNDISEPCVGRTIHWSEDGSEIGCTIETYRNEAIRGDVVRARHDVAEKLLHTVCTQILTGVNPSDS